MMASDRFEMLWRRTVVRFLGNFVGFLDGKSSRHTEADLGQEAMSHPTCPNLGQCDDATDGVDMLPDGCICRSPLPTFDPHRISISVLIVRNADGVFAAPSPIRVIFKTLISRDTQLSRFTASYAGMPMCNLIGD